MNDKLLEALADLEHKQWAHWTKYMLENLLGYNENSANQFARKCFNQINTPYSELTETEKESDREWARKTLETIHGEHRITVCKYCKFENNHHLYCRMYGEKEQT